ncbi:hypothetical protein PSN45_001243 [Yamadazyma tenuis]|uniref:Protein KRE1 n=1 Tax=Candida tenuis (strain ATCC 10573 / BCRC 21748 / CBS 615 / JCM 9827 / NBRC 10315 / NRRL Y-1498 / VKM Y-70) TaxID=590646 RepID=G3B9D7_CANTC|nr:uncharacterized protein CANTEDRAFT_115947 [Yamadazyma tenuis ATCC 10573]EGV62479.1 hypothetical protein CANTEDRAFT_115947 [Yamadazyma tenuis ATCC 10573]WEJ93769.1 hypothetical protein PSN45_001243 [Yamadazyma tenuis]
MNFTRLVLLLFSLFTTIAALADQGDGQATTNKKTTTSVWTTITTKGKTTAFQTAYFQSFMSTYSEANTDDVKSGNIGLASSADTSLGGIRTYDQTTITSPNDGHSMEAGLFSGIVGLSVIILGLL